MKVDSPGHPLVGAFPGRGIRAVRRVLSRRRTLLARPRSRALQHRHRQDRPEPTESRNETGGQDYAAAWVRHYGRGRVFYSTVGAQSRISSGIPRC